MVVGDDVRETDVLVVGGGPGGYTTALGAARAGRRVLVVERAPRLGGVCLDAGCIPSKALLHVAEIAGRAADAHLLGLDVSVRVDMARVQKWMTGVVAGLGDGVSGQLRRAGVEVVTGEARFVSSRRAAVSTGHGSSFVEFRHAVVATGSRAAEHPTLPFDGRCVLDAGQALALDRLPADLLVVGGGYIGLELGVAFAKLGASVTIVEAAPRLLPSFPASLVRVVARHAASLGVRVLVDTEVTGFDGTTATLQGPGAVDGVAADTVLVAVGRRPNTEDLGLDALGIQPTASGHIAVDGALRATPDVYAVGDITPGPALAHRATAQADVAARGLAGGRAVFEPACVPCVVFTDPELVSVGLTLEAAAGAGLDADRRAVPLAALGRTATLGRSDGFVELVVDRNDGTVLGVHMVGAGVAELSGEAVMAVEMAVTTDDLALMVHAHPTLSEALQEAAAAPVRGRAAPGAG